MQASKQATCAIAIVQILVFLSAVTAGHGQPIARSTCLSYEPSVVRLRGTLVRKTFPGPPNYADIHRGDKAEVYWLLNLSRPVCVDQDNTQPDSNPAHKDIRQLQLVVPAEFYSKYKSLVGHRVSVSGTLFGEHTAHHRTPVLVTVKSLAKAD